MHKRKYKRRTHLWVRHKFVSLVFTTAECPTWSAISNVHFEFKFFRNKSSTRRTLNLIKVDAIAREFPTLIFSFDSVKSSPHFTATSNGIARARVWILFRCVLMRQEVPIKFTAPTRKTNHQQRKCTKCVRRRATTRQSCQLNLNCMRLMRAPLF